MIRNIIFDLGNVIINYNQKRIINNFTEKEDEIKYIYDEILQLCNISTKSSLFSKQLNILDLIVCFLFF